MSMKKRLARMLILVLCVSVLSMGAAEVKQDITQANGKVTQIEWKDDNGKLVPGPEGYAKVRYAYKGDETTEMYFDEEGVTCKSAEGSYGKKVTVDGKGRVIAVEYLDFNGKRMLNNQVYGLMTVSYHSFGAERVVAYYGSGKRLVVVPALGYAKVVNEYSYKTMTSREYQDTKGKPVDCAQGYATVKQKLDKKSRVLSIRYDHADGKPALGPDGWFRCKFERDEDGRIMKIEYQDTNENLTDRGAGYAWEEREYDGDEVLITRYDMSGSKIADKSGVVTVARKENEDGEVTAERFLDESGKATVNALGVAGIRYTYDRNGRIESVNYVDTEGQATNCNKGYAGYTDTFDEDGATLTRTYLGKDGLPAEVTGGYSEIRYFYDETKALTDTRYYDSNGTQVKAGASSQPETEETEKAEEPEESEEEPAEEPEEEPQEEPEEEPEEEPAEEEAEEEYPEEYPD